MPGTDCTAAPRKYGTWAAAVVLLAACHAANNGTDLQDAEAGDASAADAGQSPRASDASGQPAATDASRVDGSSAPQGSDAEAGGSGGPTQRDGSAPDGAQRADAATDAGAATTTGCDKPGLVWKSAKKTNYESYPAPGSDECVKYNGCAYLGQFQACENTMPESWVKAHNIASVFPLQGLELHNLCLRAGGKTFVVTAVDTCGDGDCGGCCTKNRGTADRLIDLEKYTNERFGLADGDIEWADLGAADHAFDGCNVR